MRKALLIAFLFLSANLLATAQRIEDLSTTNLTNGSNFNFGEVNFDKALVVISHAENCPFAGMYESRLDYIINEYSSKGFSFVLLNPDKTENSQPDQIKNFIRANSISIPYLSDPDQILSKYFEISKIPEIIMLTRGDEGLKIAYRGAFDNNPQVESSVSERHFERAINQILKGQEPSPSKVRTMGCNVRTF